MILNYKIINLFKLSKYIKLYYVFNIEHQLKYLFKTQ